MMPCEDEWKSVEAKTEECNIPVEVKLIVGGIEELKEMREARLEYFRLHPTKR